VNFAEHESTAMAGAAELFHQYRLEKSQDLGDASRPKRQPQRCPSRLYTASRSAEYAVCADHQRPHAGRRDIFDSRPAGVWQWPIQAPGRRAAI
jgi:hypothetical protein